MTRFWGDVVARVSGLETAILRRDAIAALGAQGDITSFANRLEATRRLPVPVGAPIDPSAIETAFRRAAAQPLAIVARWTGDRMPVLEPLFEEEDRRSIRALLRGAAASATVDERLSGLLPTPALPHAALRELAEQPSIGQVVATLAAWKHPLAETLRAEAARPRPDLLVLESALRRRYAERALASVKRAPRGSGARRYLEAFIRRSIDAENALAASKPRSSDQVVERKASLATELRLARRAVWDDPIGMPRIILFFLRLRAEAHDLRAVLWHVALGAPFHPSTLVSPA